MIKLILTKEIISPIFIIIISILLYLLIRQIIEKMFKNSTKYGMHKKSITIIHLVTNLIKYTIIIIATLIILDIWGVDTKAMLASLGIVGVIAGLALQDILKDLLAGFDIIINNEFDVGDNIKIGDFRGDVIEVGLKNTKIRAYTGEVKIIANRNIVEIINYSTQTSRCIVDISVDYGMNLEKVETILSQVCENLSTTIPYLTSDVQILGIEKLDDSAIVYRLIADCEPTKDIPFKREIHKAVKKAFDAENIEIPYTQVVIHHAK